MIHLLFGVFFDENLRYQPSLPWRPRWWEVVLDILFDVWIILHTFTGETALYLFPGFMVGGVFAYITGDSYFISCCLGGVGGLGLILLVGRVLDRIVDGHW